PRTHRGEQAAFPQVRVMALAECGTHAIIDATLGAYTTGELSLAPALARSLTRGDAGVVRPRAGQLRPLAHDGRNRRGLAVAHPHQRGPTGGPAPPGWLLPQPDRRCPRPPARSRPD